MTTTFNEYMKNVLHLPEILAQRIVAEGITLSHRVVSLGQDEVVKIHFSHEEEMKYDH